MKFSLKNSVAIVLVLAILYLLYKRRPSGLDSKPPANCDPEPVDAKIACVTAKPQFPLAGDMINDGKQKYCCKSA